MKLYLFDPDLEITEGLLEVTTETATQTNIFGYVQARRFVSFLDPDGKVYHPQNPKSIFALTNWRSQLVKITDDNGFITFKGVILNISTEDSNKGVIVTLECVSPLRMFITTLVNYTNVLIDFLVNGIVAKGQTTVPIKSGVETVPQNAIFSASTEYLPNYLVQTATGTPTTSITIDRQLETALADNDPVFFLTPETVTIPFALKSLLRIVADEEYLLGGFDLYDTSEGAANRKVIINIRQEDNITLQQAVPLLEKMSGGRFEVASYADGTFDLIDIFSVSDIVIPLAMSELVRPIKCFVDDAALSPGAIFYHETGTAVASVLKTVSQDALNSYWAKLKTEDLEYFQPQGDLKRLRSLLHNSETTANYYAQYHVDNYGKLLLIVTAYCLPTLAANRDFVLDMKRGSKFLLTINNGEIDLTDRAAIVQSASWDSAKNLWNVRFRIMD